MTESNIIEFPGHRSRRTFELKGVQPVKIDGFDPFYLFFQAARQRNMVGLALDKQKEAITVKPVAYDRHTVQKLSEMLKIAVALESFQKLLDVRDGNLANFFSLPKQNPNTLINTANKTLKPEIDLDRAFLASYERWDKTIDIGDKAAIDETTVKRIQKDINDLAEEKRKQGISPYSQAEVAQIADKIFTASEEIFEKRGRLSAQGFNIGFIRNKD